MLMERFKTRAGLRATSSIALSMWLLVSPAFAAGEKTMAADPVNALDDDGYVPISPKELPQVSGERLMKIAYAVICAVFLLYGWSLVSREQRVERRLGQLEQQIQRREDELQKR